MIQIGLDASKVIPMKSFPKNMLQYHRVSA